MATENTSIVSTEARTVASSTSAPLPKVPKYVKLIWQALKGVSASSEVKMGWAELITRQLDALAKAQNREGHFRLETYNDPKKHPFYLMAKHLAAGERIGCMTMGLEPSETEWLIHVVTGLLHRDFTVDQLYQALRTCKNSIPA